MNKNTNTTMPGRKDLRISIIPTCNLSCNYCHNEGQLKPTLCRANKQIDIDTIEKTIRAGYKLGAKTIRFTGGEPGIYTHLQQLFEAVKNTWQPAMPNIKTWGINTNGVPFLNQTKFDLLKNSVINSVVFGIDSVEKNGFSKPESKIGISGGTLIDRVIKPLSFDWKNKQDKHIKLDVVFTGNVKRVDGVVDMAIKLGLQVAIIEVNGVMNQRYKNRKKFLRLFDKYAKQYNLIPQYFPLVNETYLVDKKQGKIIIKFYQDHCFDLDCIHCKNIHIRVINSDKGIAIVPCFLKSRHYSPIEKNNKISLSLFKKGFNYIGKGPDWDK